MATTCCDPQCSYCQVCARVLSLPTLGRRQALCVVFACSDTPCRFMTTNTPFGEGPMCAVRRPQDETACLSSTPPPRAHPLPCPETDLHRRHECVLVRYLPCQQLRQQHTKAPNVRLAVIHLMPRRAGRDRVRQWKQLASQGASCGGGEGRGHQIRGSRPDGE